MKKMAKLKLNLQHFAEKDDEGNLSNGDDDPKDIVTTPKDDDDESSKVYTEQEFNQRLNDEISRRLKQKEKEKQDAVDEAKRLAKMNKDQKAEYEREQLEKEVKQLREEKAMNEMRSEARAILLSNEIDARDEVVSLVVADTAEKTKENIEVFSAIIKKSVEDAIKANARQAVPKNGDSFNGGNSSKVYDNFAEIAKQARIIKN